MAETEHQRKTFVNYNSNPDSRVFRNNVGGAWAGKKIPSANGSVYLANAYFIRFGLCVGSADLIGLESITITKEMVGQKIGRFLAVECKAVKGVHATKQKDFRDLVEKLGGKYVLSKESKNES